MNTPMLILHLDLIQLKPELTGFELLNMLKSRFASVFREVNGCLGRDGCCSGGDGCHCNVVFGQQLATDPYALRRFQKPPLPFAFRLSAESLTHSVRFSTELQLTLVGYAISHLDRFVKAVLLLIERSGGWRPVSLGASAADGSRTKLPLDSPLEGFSSLPLLTFGEFVTGNPWTTSKIKLNFHTPLRLMQNGSPLRNPSFSAVAGALFRRISSLAYYYGREELPHDFKWLAEQSREVVTMQSAVQWANRGATLQGVDGVLNFKGELAEFMPFIELGCRLNVGKGAAYGAGSFIFSCG